MLSRCSDDVLKMRRRRRDLTVCCNTHHRARQADTQATACVLPQKPTQTNREDKHHISAEVVNRPSEAPLLAPSPDPSPRGIGRLSAYRTSYLITESVLALG